jgi:UDP-glucose 4-epimerase
LKQVPVCEFYPLEAVKTNVLGAANLINGCLAAGVARAVLLSTDKAVYPINAMGMSKAMMEKLVTSSARSLIRREGETIFNLTRYGNVMASRGSVIPLFISQIKAGGPITITDPSMTRFLMSLEDSVDLVLHAFTNGKQGDLFVQKAPACTVETLCAALLEIFEARSRVQVKVIGTRHGEKVFESLVSREEMAHAQDSGRYFRIPADTRDLNYHQYLDEGDLRTTRADEYNSHNTKRLEKDEVIPLLLSLDYVQRELRTA